MAPSTVARLLRCRGLNRLSELEPGLPAQRFEYAKAGELLHLDIKKLGRFWKPGHRVAGDRQHAADGAGWDFVHVAIDDASRDAQASVQPDERGMSVCRALLQAMRFCRACGVRISRVMTDNGSCYRSRTFRRLLRRLGLRHLRTKPYTPQTNGKAERFIQTALREWANGRRYDTSCQRAQLLPAWLHHYNHHRPHSSLGYRAPIYRLAQDVSNVLGLHT